MSEIELIKSTHTVNGHNKYIVFDHSDNSIKGVICVTDAPYISNIEQCYKLTMSDGSIKYIDDIAEAITSQVN